jgi:CHAT domain-containing protein
MDADDLVQALLHREDRRERREILEQVQPLETRFFEAIKARVGEWVGKRPEEALRVAQIGIEAARYAAEREGEAFAHWAKGNALLFLGRHDDCLASYSTSIAVWASLGRRDEVAQLQSNCMPPLMWTGRYAEAQAMGHAAMEVVSGQPESRQMGNLVLNLGVCDLRQGEYDRAVSQIERAEAVFDRLGNPVEAARCRVTQAVALERMDRFREAEALLQGVLPVFAEGKAWVARARAMLNLGVLRARLADHQAALRWLGQSRSAFAEANIEMDARIADLHRAQSLLDVGLLPEAAVLGRALVEAFERLAMPRQVARSAALLAQVQFQSGELDAALEELDRARRLFQVQGDSLRVAVLDLMRARILLAQGRPGDASRLAFACASALDVEHFPVRHAQAHLIVAACCEMLGLIGEAQVAYGVAWTAASYPTGTTEPPASIAYRVAHARGAIAEAAGDRALARGEYGRAVGYLNQVSQRLGVDELRGGYLEDKRTVYESALRLSVRDVRTADAFAVSEWARCGALRDALGRHQTRRTDSPERARLDELKARWTRRTSVLHRAVDVLDKEQEAVSPAERLRLLREVAELEREVADAYRRSRLADPRFALLEQEDVLPLPEAQRRLSRYTAMLVFEHVGDELLAFVLTDRATEIVPLGSLSELRWVADGLMHQMQEVSLFDDPGDLAMLEQELLVDARACYERLLAKPLAVLAERVRRLWIVPCDALGGVPLEALHDGERYVVQRFGLCYLPSASLLAVLPERRAGCEGRPLLLAHSWGGRLPRTLEEASAVAECVAPAFEQSPVLLLEERATAKALRAHAPGAGLLHIVAHSEYRDQAPLFSSLALGDGPLLVNEVYDLDLTQTGLVTLSGCETGLSKGLGGEMLGLAHAFLYAGAPTLVVGRWRVDDACTEALMRRFYAGLMRGETVVDALREAELEMLERQPHPGHWAAFAAWGQGFQAPFAGRGGETGRRDVQCCRI